VKREKEGERSCWDRGEEEKEREMIENRGENLLNMCYSIV
jgi:hypothetical protein